MTDPELLAKKFALIETCVRELRSLARPTDIVHDVREERFVEHTLQIAIQAALDAASHVVSDARLGEPRTNRELFDLLAKGGCISPELARSLRDMAGSATCSCTDTRTSISAWSGTSCRTAWTTCSPSCRRSDPASTAARTDGAAAAPATTEEGTRRPSEASAELGRRDAPAWGAGAAVASLDSAVAARGLRGSTELGATPLDALCGWLTQSGMRPRNPLRSSGARSVQPQLRRDFGPSQSSQNSPGTPLVRA